MRKILLFDTIIDGHHPDYLTHLITYWLRTQPTGELIVVAPASFESVFQPLTAHNPLGATVRFDPISQQEIDQTHQAKNLNRSLSEWNLALTYMDKHIPTHALLMYFDVFQYGILFGRKAPCPVSGIYFRPDFHYAGLGGLKNRLRVLRKETALRLVLNRKSVANLFCLDHSAVPLVQAMNPRVRVIPLPDPVKQDSVSVAEVEQLRSTLKIEPGRAIFLLFGHMDDRKGLEQLLDALNLTDPALHHQFCFLLVGSIPAVYQQLIERKLADVPSGIQVIPVFRLIRSHLIHAYFKLADIVLTPYQHHVGMASILVRAAAAGKPVLSSNYGYMGHVVEKEQLGSTMDSTSPAAICRALEQAVTNGVPHSTENLPVFASQHTHNAFAETLFGQF